MAKELSDMTMEELRSHAKDVGKEIARREGDRISLARKSIRKRAREFGTSIEELFGQKPRSKVNGTAERRVLYVDDEGKKWRRAKSNWTEAQKKKYKANREKELGS